MEHFERAANHLAGTAWDAAPDLSSVDMDTARAAFSGESGNLPTHLINQLARQALGMEDGRGSVEQYRQRLAQQHWLLRERVLTADTKYRGGDLPRQSQLTSVTARYGPARHDTPGGADAARGLTADIRADSGAADGGGHYIVSFRRTLCFWNRVSG